MIHIYIKKTTQSSKQKKTNKQTNKKAQKNTKTLHFTYSTKCAKAPFELSNYTLHQSPYFYIYL